MHPEGKCHSRSDLSSSACYQWHSCQARLMQSCKALRDGLRGAFAPSEIVLHGCDSAGRAVQLVSIATCVDSYGAALETIIS
jgi:hypothetical protein